MTVSDEDLKYLVENDYYDIPIHKDKDVEFIDVADIARELLERRERDRWIPVSERLPDNETDVIAFDKTFETIVAYLTDFAGEREWSDGEYLLERVTHWRLLPEPPEAD